MFSLLEVMQGRVEGKQLLPCFLGVPVLHLLAEQNQQSGIVVWWYTDAVIVLWETNNN